MSTKAEIRVEAARLQGPMLAAGALSVEPDILQPSATLLDLYGEDIRARAYVTSDPLRGEQMLRPDFTAPLVQMHLASGRDAARYTYAGEIFRRQDDDPDRPSEYIQVGYECIGIDNRASADAEVFATLLEAARPHDLRLATGDIGLLISAVQGLETTERRKSALLRHIWRPRRFRALLDRFSSDVSREIPTRTDGHVHIGLRTREEIADRFKALEEDAATPPIDPEQSRMLSRLLSVRGPVRQAAEDLQDLARLSASLSPAVEAMIARNEALTARGVDLDRMDFEASYGRTTLEYYDGFVFGFYCEAQPDLPPVATGGRYDALTRVLSGGASVPAVGGVIRPGLTLGLARGAAA